jgi:nitroreductase
MTNTINSRTADHPVQPMFLERWSPRAFTGEAMPERELMTILEAARWAPSSFNAQPWRFIYARRGTQSWEKLLGLLIPQNAVWAANASVLIYVASHTLMKSNMGEMLPSRTHSFDAGAAWGYLALQAHWLGWKAHAMAGFDTERAPAVLGAPAEFRVEAAIAIGRQADKSILPESLQARELPSGREPLAALVFEGSFASLGVLAVS